MLYQWWKSMKRNERFRSKTLFESTNNNKQMQKSKRIWRYFNLFCLYLLLKNLKKFKIPMIKIVIQISQFIQLIMLMIIILQKLKFRDLILQKTLIIKSYSRSLLKTLTFDLQISLSSIIACWYEIQIET